MALRDTVCFPRIVLGPMERSALLRLAQILRSGTGGLLCVFLRGCVSCEESCKDMRMPTTRLGIWSAAAATQFLIVNANTPGHGRSGFGKVGVNNALNVNRETT